MDILHLVQSRFEYIWSELRFLRHAIIKRKIVKIFTKCNVPKTMVLTLYLLCFGTRIFA